MLLESALADFKEESTSSSTYPGVMPSGWDDNSLSHSKNSPFYERRSCQLNVHGNEGLHLHGDAAEMSNARKNPNGGHNRSDSGQFYHKEGSVPFKWEAAPGKPMLNVEDSPNPESPRLRPPPALRSLAISNVTGRNSPLNNSSIAGKMKSILSGKVPRCVNVTVPNYHKATPERDWSSGSGRDDTDRDSSADSDGGEESSPVSTLDRPASPISPTCSPKQHDSVTSYRHGLGGNHRTISARPSSHMSHCSVAVAEMSEELPAVMEEDEEDMHFHTMEFPTVDSPGTIEERRERSLLRRPGSSKSMSAPLSRRHHSLSSQAANRGRRRSDFDWPEDFEERPEEVVKEVDESLWAFSPVASSFVFSGNEASNGNSNRSPSRDQSVATVSSTPSSSNSGSLRETLSLRRSIMRSSSQKNGYGGKSSREGDANHVEFSGPLGVPSLMRYGEHSDDESHCRVARGHPMKRTFSCVPAHTTDSAGTCGLSSKQPFFNLCKSQRPTPKISFSQRLIPGAATFSLRK